METVTRRDEQPPVPPQAQPLHVRAVASFARVQTDRLGRLNSYARSTAADAALNR